MTWKVEWEGERGEPGTGGAGPTAWKAGSAAAREWGGRAESRKGADRKRNGNEADRMGWNQIKLDRTGRNGHNTKRIEKNGNEPDRIG